MPRIQHWTQLFRIGDRSLRKLPEAVFQLHSGDPEPGDRLSEPDRRPVRPVIPGKRPRGQRIRPDPRQSRDEDPSEQTACHSRNDALQRTGTRAVALQPLRHRERTATSRLNRITGTADDVTSR